MRVFWDNAEKTILIREFSKDWAWEEYYASLLQLRHMLQEVEHGVYIIIDTLQIEALPKESLHHLQAGNRNLPSHVLMRFLVSKNRVVSDLYSMLRQIAPADFNEFYIVSSMETAYQKISDAQSQASL